MAIQHQDSTQIHKFAFVQSGDPGAVGANKGWVDTSNPTYILKVRNSGNTGWINIGVLGSDVVGASANNVALLQRTRWNLSVDGPTMTILVVPSGKNVILNKIVITSLADTTSDLNTYDVWFTSGAMNLTSQLYDKTAVAWADFAKGLGLAGPGFVGSLSAEYDEANGFINDFGIIQSNIVAETDYPGFIPHEIEIFVFGTIIDNIY